MAIALLVRHGRTTANSAGVLAGRTRGVHLDDAGKSQAEDLARRIGVLPLTRIVSSPLTRCRETAARIAREQKQPTRVAIDGRLTECGYGTWTGQKLSVLAKDPLWKQVQTQPSAVTFPEGESMRAMQTRAVEAVRAIDAGVERDAGPDGVWVGISHADVIKSVLADVLGMHLDLFQRIVLDPASISVVHFTPDRPFVLRINDLATDLSGLRPRKRRRRKSRGDAVVGGGAGSGVAVTE